MTQTVNAILYCPRSGLPLAKLEALCAHGWPLVNSLTSNLSGIVHPVYGLALPRLISKLKTELEAAESAEWDVQHTAQQEIQVTVSAIMYSLDAIWQPPSEAHHLWKSLEPSLPAWPVCVASAGRVLGLASWWHFATSKRLAFPRYRVSAANKNLQWQNFATWLDDAWAIKTDWESRKQAVDTAEELRHRTDALLAVRADKVYKRIDFNRVWRWVDIQLAADKRYPAGRRETFKSIFMGADLAPQDWTLDDLEDLQQAMLECCDLGNEIMFFINQRMSNMREILKDFYSSFTLLNNVAQQGDLSDLDSTEEQEKTSEFFASFDRRAESIDDLPPEPQRHQFATIGLFLQAQAQHRILARRFAMQGKVASVPASVPASAQVKPSPVSQLPDAPL